MTAADCPTGVSDSPDTGLSERSVGPTGGVLLKWNEGERTGRR